MFSSSPNWFHILWLFLSQFGDIYQEEHFINYLKPDIQIVKELPKELGSLDLEAIGSLVRHSSNLHPKSSIWSVAYSNNFSQITSILTHRLVSGDGCRCCERGKAKLFCKIHSSYFTSQQSSSFCWIWEPVGLRSNTTWITGILFYFDTCQRVYTSFQPVTFSVL